MSRNRPWQNKEKLERLYYEKGLTQDAIADYLGCSKSCISKWMSKHGIETERGLVLELRDKQWLIDEYKKEQKSAKEIANELECSEYCVFYWLDKHGIETRKSPVETYQSVTTDRNGYERFHATIDGATAKIKHHRLLAVAKYGFESVVGKEIHYINNIPWDNRRSNITLIEKSDHARQHSVEKSRDKNGRFV